jgi:hypothetical protein
MGSKSDSFDINFGLLPPRLQAELWVLALDANTSKVSLAYSPGTFRTNLAYNYGGNVQASMAFRQCSVTVGVNPANADVNVDLGLVFHGFNFGSSTNVTQRSSAIDVSYGKKLLPFPDELNSVFNAGNTGLQNMAKDVQAAPNNPLAWYKLHSDDANAISKAVSAGRQIADSNKSTDRFGGRLRLNYSPERGFTIYGAVGLSF